MADFLDNEKEGKSDTTHTEETTPTSTPTKPSLPAILILGGCGYVGRNLVHYLVTENLASFIKIADKARPEMAYFHEKYVEAFQSPLVQYEQDDLTK
jgi:hypothetical protein